MAIIMEILVYVSWVFLFIAALSVVLSRLYQNEEADTPTIDTSHAAGQPVEYSHEPKNPIHFNINSHGFSMPDDKE